MKTVSGSEIVARLATLEAFVRVMVHGIVQRHPEMKDEMLEALKDAALERAKGFERLDVTQYAEAHADEFLEGVREAIGATS